MGHDLEKFGTVGAAGLVASRATLDSPVSTAPPATAGAVAADAPARPVAAAGPRRTLVVATLTALGVLTVAVAYTFGRSGQQGVGTAVLWGGLLTVFVPAAVRLLSPAVGRTERLWCAHLLGLGLLLCDQMAQLAGFTSFDELLHLRTLNALMQSGELFQANPGLPVSPRYPGLEVLTDAVAQLTHTSGQVAGLIVLIALRLLLVACLFQLVERVTGSSFAAGIGVLIYVMSPQFFVFNSMFAYQTLALPLTVAVLLLLEQCLARRRLAMTLALLAAACLVVTHHVTSWLTIALVALWALCCLTRRDRRSAIFLGAAAGVGLVLVAAWTSLSATMIQNYVTPVLESGIDEFLGVVVGNDSSRRFFADSSGTTTPLWERLALVGSVLLWIATLLPLSAFRRRPHVSGPRAGLFRAMRVLHYAYPLTLAGMIVPTAAELMTRLSTFIFLGIAVVVGYGLASYLEGTEPAHRFRSSALSQIQRARRPAAYWVAAMVAIVPFVGGTILGSGGDWSRMPGPYLVGADGRSIDRYAQAASTWAETSLPPGTRFAADRQNGALLGSKGHPWVVSGANGGVSTGPLYFGRILGHYERSLLSKGGIALVVVDSRLAEGPPHETFYVEPGEAPPGTRLTRAQLEKFASTPGSVPNYDNGKIKIYDVTRLWEPRQASTAAQNERGGR